MQVAGYCWRKEDIIPPGILDSESLKASLEVNTIEVATFHGLLNILLKHPSVGLQLNGGLLVQGILRVGLLK